MKGPMGLIVAALLGVLGVALNWLYLQSKAAQVENVSFLGVRPDNKIEIGQLLREADFVEVKIPKNNARGLEQFVYLYKDLNLIIGIHATRTYKGGELVYLEHYRTPPTELRLDRHRELLMWVNVDSSSFVPEQVDPGDKISFLIPKVHGPTPAARPIVNDDTNEPAPQPVPTVNASGDGELIGPFTVATIGNRLGSYAIAKANQNVSVGGNIIGIAVENIGNADSPKLEPKAARLAALLEANPSMRARVLLNKPVPR